MTEIYYKKFSCRSSTPIHKDKQKMSFCASIESRGYGTMTSIDPMRPDNLRRRDPTTYKSSAFVRQSESRISFSPEMIAPPCSVNQSDGSDEDFFDEELFLQNSKNFTNFFECVLCHEKFRHAEDLYKHQDSHLLDTPKKSDTQKSSEKCRKCGKKYKNKTKLKLHFDQAHPGEMVILMVL